MIAITSCVNLSKTYLSEHLCCNVQEGTKIIVNTTIRFAYYYTAYWNQF